MAACCVAPGTTELLRRDVSAELGLVENVWLDIVNCVEYTSKGGSKSSIASKVEIISEAVWKNLWYEGKHLAWGR